MRLMMELKDKVAVITGASSGFGESIAWNLAEAGMKLALGARRVDRLENMATKLNGHGASQVWFQKLDVCDEKSSQDFAQGALKEFGHVDALINNAGLALGKDEVSEAELADWEKMMDTNFLGIFRVTQPILKSMKERNAGHILQIGSIAGHDPYEGGGAYCASKFAVKAFTRVLRRELVGSNLRVTTIDPGLAETEYSIVRFKGDQAKADATYNGIRPLQATDVAEAVRFALSRPLHVNIDEMVLTCIDQAGATKVVRQSN